MKTYSNKIDPPKKKKPGVELTFTRGKEEKTYTPSRALTGDKRYGKENPNGKDAKFIEDARAKKQDIAYDKDNKPYRAGVTEIKKQPDKVNVSGLSARIPSTKEIIKPQTIKKEVKPSGKSYGKLKPMAMTYGTDDPVKGGGTRYKNKVRAMRGK